MNKDDLFKAEVYVGWAVQLSQGVSPNAPARRNDPREGWAIGSGGPPKASAGTGAWGLQIWPPTRPDATGF